MPPPAYSDTVICPQMSALKCIVKHATESRVWWDLKVWVSVCVEGVEKGVYKPLAE
jgi:hypothetical protein